MNHLSYPSLPFVLVCCIYLLHDELFHLCHQISYTCYSIVFYQFWLWYNWSLSWLFNYIVLFRGYYDWCKHLDFDNFLSHWTSKLLKLVAEFGKWKEMKQFLTVLLQTGSSVLRGMICSFKGMIISCGLWWLRIHNTRESDNSAHFQKSLGYEHTICTTLHKL